MKMLQALKVLVIVMAVIIAVGLAALGYGMYQKAKELGTGSKESLPKSGKFEQTLPIPPNCQIADMKPDGSRLYLRLEPKQAPDRKCGMILIIDTTTGTSMGTLKTEP
ncbi:MAG: hypothetical protein ACO3MW_15310 [Rhodospirillales bacterium]|jgi:hypothetical protein